VYAHALKQLHHVQARSEEATSALKPYTVDLLAYARNNLDRLADDVVVPTEEQDEEAHDDSGLEVEAGSMVTDLMAMMRSARKVQ
jgi:hypothetical protein